MQRRKNLGESVLFLLLLILPSALSAQDGDTQIRTFFKDFLCGRQGKIPEKHFKANRLENERSLVWEAWRDANRIWDEPALPPLDSIGAAVVGDWELPDSIEPHAVMPFYFGYKGERPMSGYPLFLYLHGSGPKAQEWSNGLVLAKRFADSPSLYFIPQIPNEGRWYRWYQRSKQFAWERLLRQALLRPDVNARRLYVFGISEGGYGSQRLASFYADYWAGAGPMAGGEPLKNAPAENLGHVAFSLLTGAEDKDFYRDILTGYTRSALDSLSAAYPAEYVHHVELIPGRGHHIDYSPTTPWLSGYERNPWPRHFIWEDYEMDGRHRNGFYNLLVNERPTDSLRTRYDVDINGNTVNVKVQDVHYATTEQDSVYGIEMKFARTYTPSAQGRFTLFLDEHLVDLSRPVIVRVNGKQFFKGKLRLDRRHMLRSVAAFYDPCRIYPAAVDVAF